MLKSDSENEAPRPRKYSWRSYRKDVFYSLSLVGMKLAEKYKKNFDVSSEGPLSGVTSFETSKFS